MHQPSVMQAASIVPLLFLPHSLSFPLTNQGRIFNCMSPIYKLPLDRTTNLIAQSSKLNSVSHDLAIAITHLFLSSHLSPPLSQLVFCLRKGAIFFFLISTPPPNPPDLAIAVLHPLRSLSFPQSLTLSSSSHRVYHVYVVNKYFYFDFWLC